MTYQVFLDELKPLVTRRQLNVREPLFRRDEVVFALFVVEVGRIRLVRHLADGTEVCLHIARVGESFAEAALFSEIYHCDAIALAPFNSDSAFSQMNHEVHGTAQITNLVTPTIVGQDAFAAIQEIVAILEADPSTDWSRVNLAALREHLIDMNEVTLNAAIAEQKVDGGLEITITGTGRTAEAISRLVPAHTQELNRMDGMQATVTLLSDGVRLTVTSNLVERAEQIRNLGFLGLLVKGVHHQQHHLALAMGIRMN